MPRRGRQPRTLEQIKESLIVRAIDYARARRMEGEYLTEVRDVRRRTMQRFTEDVNAYLRATGQEEIKPRKRAKPEKKKHRLTQEAAPVVAMMTTPADSAAPVVCICQDGISAPMHDHGTDGRCRFVWTERKSARLKKKGGEFCCPCLAEIGEHKFAASDPTDSDVPF